MQLVCSETKALLQLADGGGALSLVSVSLEKRKTASAVTLSKVKF